MDLSKSVPVEEVRAYAKEEKGVEIKSPRYVWIDEHTLLVRSDTKPVYHVVTKDNCTCPTFALYLQRDKEGWCGHIDIIRDVL